MIAFGGEYKEADRLVVSIGHWQSQNYVFCRYDSQLASARSTGTRKGCAVGSSLASVFMIMFTSYAIAFW